MVLAEWNRARECLRAAETFTRERCYADAMSRTYYAILHAAKAALHVHDIAAESHPAVRRMFGLHLVKPGEIEAEWAAYLVESLDDRLAADYDVQCSKGENLPASQASAQASRYQRYPTWCEEGNAVSSAQGASPAGRWRPYDYDELINRDKASLDIFWLRDESLEESDNLPDPDVLAQEIVEDLEAALGQFRRNRWGLEWAEDVNPFEDQRVARIFVAA